MAAEENKINGFYDIGENQKVEMTVYSGDTEVSVTEKDVDGDVNGDNGINTDDIILTRRFITGGWGVSIIEEAADVDADDKYTARDVILMRRFVADGYDVELK